jgi:hypothetical protein
MNYKIYAEGEEIGDFDTMEEIVDWLRKERDLSIEDERVDMERYPEFYEEGYDPEVGVNEYMRDVYQIMQTIPFPEL